MLTIDRDSPVPLYYQLKQALKQKIDAGALQPGDKVPTEDELCERYDISRTPVRQALAELVNEGMLVRIRGRGTFVTNPPSEDGTGDETTLRVVVPDTRWKTPLERAATIWNTEHPDDQVDIDFEMVPLGELRSTLIAAVGRGEAPDISLLDSVWVAEFAQQQYLHSLNEIDPAWLRSNERLYFDVMLSANRYQNRIYGLPVSADFSVLWYRKDWFSAEGLTPPATWDDLVAAGRHFQHDDVRTRYNLGPFPLVLVGGRAGGETTTYQILPWLWSAGGDLVTGGSVELDSEQNRRTLAFLQSLVQQHALASPDVVTYGWDEAARRFGAGEAALAFGGTYESLFIRETAGWSEEEFLERVGFVSIPAGPDGRRSAIVGGMTYAVYRQASSPQMALKLLEITTRPEISRPFSVQTGHSPAQPAVAEAIQQETPNSFLARTVPLVAVARPRPALPDFARVSRQFQQLVQDCLTAARPLDVAISVTAGKIAALIESKV